MGADIADYNTQLTQSVWNFQANYTDLGSITVFDTQPIFNTLLDEWQTFGFVNVTGYCAAYENGTPTTTYQVEGCAPVSSYLWVTLAFAWTSGLIEQQLAELTPPVIHCSQVSALAYFGPLC